MDSITTRERILNAAMRVVDRVGFHKATLDEIISEAEISKGGFLYHFSTKRACFLALIDKTFEGILEETYRVVATMPDGPGRLLKAYIIAWLKWQEPPCGLTAPGVLEDPALRERVSGYRIQHYEIVLDPGIPELTVQTVLLICAGLWTTPLLARATPQEMTMFRRIMGGVMLNMIDQAAIDMKKSGSPDNAGQVG